MSTAKDFLRLVRLAEERAEPEMERLRTLVDRAGYGTGQKEAQRVSGTSQRSRVEDNICAKVDLETEYRQRGKCIKRSGDPHLIDYAGLRYEAMTIINKIPRYSYRQVLIHYYVDALTWPEVARTMKRSLRGAQSLNGHALEVFGRIWENSKNT